MRLSRREILRQRKKAYREAYAVAWKKYPLASRPDLCSKCKKRRAKQRHHVITVRELIDAGVHLSPSAHVCVWVCIPCHEAIHGRKIAWGGKRRRRRKRKR